MIPLEIFEEDTQKKQSGAYIYPVSGEDMYFIVPRVGGFEYQKQIRDIQRNLYGVYYDGDVDMTLIQAKWLGEHVQGFGGFYEVGKKREIKFSREKCRQLFNNPAYHDSLVQTLIMKASNFESYLTKKGREAIEELKKR